MFLILNRIEPARQIGGTWVVVGALVDDAAVTRNRWSKGASRCHSVILHAAVVVDYTSLKLT